MRAALEKIDSTKAYSVEEAVALAQETNFAKFDATVGRPRRLTALDISFVAEWAVRQARFGARLSPDLGRIISWNSHM